MDTSAVKDILKVEKSIERNLESHIEKRVNHYIILANHLVIFLLAAITLVGAAIATWEFSLKEIQSRREQQIKELTTFGSFAELVKEQRIIEADTVQYLKSINGKNTFSRERFRDLLKKYGTGSAIYYADEFKTFRKIYTFYEELGLQVDRGALDFDLVFESIIFPTDFAIMTKDFSKFLGANWFGKEQSIAGFGLNVQKLMKLYEDRRMEWRKKQAKDLRHNT